MKKYAVLCIKKDVVLEIYGAETKVPLSFAEGMIGAIPVFDTLEDANEYAGDKFQTATLDI